MAKVYIASSGSARTYFVTETPKNVKVYLTTVKSKKLYLSTEDFKPTKIYVSTPSFKKVYLTSEEPKKAKVYLVTPGFKKVYLVTEELDISEYDNICYYPKELDRIRQKATLLLWDEVKKKLYSSLDYESWGKVNTKGYFSAGNLRLLLDYLSSIWLERDNDSKSGLVRTSDFYYTKYNINDIIVNFRKCDINIKPIVALFNLNSYSVQDDGWPNYFVINNILNPPTEQDMPTLKQYTDIFTLESIVLDSNQSKYSIINAQTNFPLTKQLKYLTNFSINGSDYIGYVDYNYTSVTYDAPQLNGYTITSSDTVTITYWYEE
jgi:hypothetical protein